MERPIHPASQMPNSSQDSVHVPSPSHASDSHFPPMPGTTGGMPSAAMTSMPPEAGSAIAPVATYFSNATPSNTLTLGGPPIRLLPPLTQHQAFHPNAHSTPDGSTSASHAPGLCYGTPMAQSPTSGPLIIDHPAPQMQTYMHPYPSHPVSGPPGMGQNAMMPMADPDGLQDQGSGRSPTHVVGQQGRRGILPSAPGYKTATRKEEFVPEKGDDGKYACPHCTKRYLHAKHLKRHYFRHIGHRPYVCKLCGDSFTRSDILKRHFQKCSQRRGEPPDSDHLEGTRGTHRNRMIRTSAAPAYFTVVAGDDADPAGNNTPAGTGADCQLHLPSFDSGNVMPSGPNGLMMGLPRALGYDAPSQLHADLPPFPEQAPAPPTAPSPLTAPPPTAPHAAPRFADSPVGTARGYSDPPPAHSGRTSRSNSLMPAPALNGANASSVASDQLEGVPVSRHPFAEPYAYGLPPPDQSSAAPGPQPLSSHPHHRRSLSSSFVPRGEFEPPPIAVSYGLPASASVAALPQSATFPSMLSARLGFDGHHAANPELDSDDETGSSEGSHDASQAWGMAEPGQYAMPNAMPVSGEMTGVFQSPEEPSASDIDNAMNIDPFQIGWDKADPLEAKANAIYEFCFPSDIYHSGEDLKTKKRLAHFFTLDSIKKYVRLFGNFQGHWPTLHMPTFNPTYSWDGWLLVMVSIGAVYSDNDNLEDVRELMEEARRAVHRSSRIIAELKARCGLPTSDLKYISQTSSDFDEFLALLLSQVTFTWNGTEEQRTRVREDYWMFTALARQIGLFSLYSENSPHYSLMHHQSEHAINDLNILRSRWQWETWARQEERIRAVYLVYLFDTAMCLYFNLEPFIDITELNIPLPTDDAVWEARDSAQCAMALGLHGPEIQKQYNRTGSRRLIQPDLHSCIRALRGTKYRFHNLSTNAYGKFIIVHGLVSQVWIAQRYGKAVVPNSRVDIAKVTQDQNLSSLSSVDWLYPSSMPPRINVPPAANSPSFAIEVDTSQLSIVAMHAMDKWKEIWDRDIDLQYPRGTKRVGFCRDAIHFYFITVRLLALPSDPYAKSKRQTASKSPPGAVQQQRQQRQPYALAGDMAIPRAHTLYPSEQRFQMLMNILKHAKHWVASKGAQEGKEMGSIVDLRDEYAIDNLTADMKLLFTPIGEGDADSPQHQSASG